MISGQISLQCRPTYEKLVQMKYLEMVIKETLRLYPIGNRIERVAKSNVEVSGVIIPKGMVVATPIHTLQRDPDVWPDPDSFKPERYTKLTQRLLPHFVRCLNYGSFLIGLIMTALILMASWPSERDPGPALACDWAYWLWNWPWWRSFSISALLPARRQTWGRYSFPLPTVKTDCVWCVTAWSGCQMAFCYDTVLFLLDSAGVGKKWICFT